MTGLLPSLAAVGGVLLAAAAAGVAASRPLFPRGDAYRAERAAWGVAAGFALLAIPVPLSLFAGGRPGAISLLAVCLTAVVVARLVSVPAGGSAPRPPSDDAGGGDGRLARAALAAVLAAGVLLYALRALTEPMWAGDYLAIWGWKGKVIFGAGALPEWTRRMPEFGFTHPEYPLGLPALYAGVAFLLRRFDDHALALIFPVAQAASCLALAGWLRRRGTAATVALAAAAALSLFEPLYRAFTTGMAEVPLSFFLLLFGTAWTDALDAEPGALRRLVFASAALAALKNEGLFAAGAATLLSAAAAAPRRDRARAALAAGIPAVAVAAAHRLASGPLPLRDFDFGLSPVAGAARPRPRRPARRSRRSPPARSSAFSDSRSSSPPAGALRRGTGCSPSRRCCFGAYAFLPASGRPRPRLAGPHGLRAHGGGARAARGGRRSRSGCRGSALDRLSRSGESSGSAADPAA